MGGKGARGRRLLVDLEERVSFEHDFMTATMAALTAQIGDLVRIAETAVRRAAA